MKQVLVLVLKNKSTVIHSIGSPIIGIVGQYISVQLKLKHIYEVNNDTFSDNVNTDVDELKRRLHKIIVSMCNKVFYSENNTVDVTDKCVMLKRDKPEQSEQIEQIYVELSN